MTMKRAFAICLLTTLCLNGCNSKTANADLLNQEPVNKEEPAETYETEKPRTGLDHETSYDAEVDIKALKEDNEDIFGWISVYQTDIDDPLLQNLEDGDFYITHNARKEDDDKGALYIEPANVPDMCDFLTVIHGNGSNGGVFEDLYRYADPDFFEKNDKFYIYLEDNILTYTVFACEETERTDLLAGHNLTTEQGCIDFIDDFYAKRSMGRLIRDDWQEGALSPYFFLVALCAEDPQKPDKRFTVYGCLINDTAGKIDRTFRQWDEEWDYDYEDTDDPDAYSADYPKIDLDEINRLIEATQ